ncbi:MAG: hypothetical protein COA67_06730 [Lutibacter sp.]|nr:MAG: hypothetical protein COA67_06730 [Lutibacter sp.]
MIMFLEQSNILDTWSFTAGEWNRFVAIEKRIKREDNIYFGIGILVLCTPGLMILRSTSFLTALLFSAPLALLIPWLRMKFSNPHLKDASKESIIEIYHEHLTINSKKIDLYGKKKWLKDMKIIETNDNFKLLEFTVEWKTRNGNTNDETRIPIPKGKELKALELIEFYREY